VTAIPEKPVRSFLLKNLVRDGDGYRWRLNLPAIRRSYDDILGWDGEGVFDGPALFVGGGQSHYLHADRDEKLVRSHFPNATIRMIPDAGHWLHADAPDELREIVCEFMEGV
jgi:esterase